MCVFIDAGGCVGASAEKSGAKYVFGDESGGVIAAGVATVDSVSRTTSDASHDRVSASNVLSLSSLSKAGLYIFVVFSDVRISDSAHLCTSVLVWVAFHN